MLNSEDQTGARPVANVSVAISTLDRPEALSVCLKSLFAGEVLPAEIVVVDQSRDERTQQIVESCDAGPVSLIYIHHDGRGLGAAQNIAIRNASQPIVAVTDDDCEPAPNWIALIERSFAPPNSIDALTGRVLPAGPQVKGTYAVSSRTSLKRVDFQRKAMPWEIGSGNNFSVKREWLQRIGGNDERLGPGSPGQGAVDMDLFYRLLRTGARIRYEPDLVVYHARTSRAGRISRRIPYGYGMGVFCRIWLQRRDQQVMYVLVRWMQLRIRRLWEGIRKHHWLQVYEELLVLAGTVQGFLRGIRLPVKAASGDPIKIR